MSDSQRVLSPSFSHLTYDLFTFSVYSAEDVDVPTSVWEDTRVIPAYASAASLILLLLTAIAYVPAVKRRLWDYLPYPPDQVDGVSEFSGRATTVTKARAHIRSRGGIIVYAFLLVRLLGCLALVGLSVAAEILHRHSRITLDHANWRRPALTHEESANTSLTAAYVYATIMSLCALAFGPVCRRVCNAHATWVLLVLFGVFGWRNLLPLTMFAGVPADFAIPWLLWSHGILITVVGLVVPLLIPGVYRPVDPMNPAAVPNPEQTASILSFNLYFFLESLVWTAYRLPRLPYENLPPLADYDWAKHLAARSMDSLEPLRRRQRGLKDRSLFFGLLSVFRWDYFYIVFLLIITVTSGFLRPIGVNRLLNYLETGGYGAVYRPWVWILFIFASPMISSGSRQLYVFFTTRMSVQVESILVQLIFQHSLKIRLMDEQPAVAPAAVSTPSAEGPVSSPAGGPSETQEGSSSGSSENGTAVGTDANASVAPTPPVTPGANYRTPPPSKSARQSKADVSKGKSVHIAGKINNLIGTDLNNVVEGRDFMIAIVDAPLEIALCIWFLYAVLGWSAFVGMAVLVISLPVPSLISRLISKVQKEQMKKTDARVQTITDTISILRMVKMFGWDSMVKEQIAEKRNEELALVRKRKLLSLSTGVVNYVLPLGLMVSTFATYTLVTKQDLTASKVFSSMTVFRTLQGNLNFLFFYLVGLIQGKVSLDRIGEFLYKTPLLDKFGPDAEASSSQTTAPPETNAPGFHNATFEWMDSSHGPPVTGQRNFRLHVDDLIFKPDTINLIVGPTGSGKTSILMALLGEMHFCPSSPEAWYHLPRSRGVSYAAQESWVQNETIKQNILFGEPYDAKRYEKVLYECALERDLALFDAGDNTEVGEKGLTLSGGQKARVTLARAIYSKAGIVLLDDVLSALDVHTARWIVDKCFRGDLVKDRTVLLVTHNVALAAPIAGYVVSLDGSGRILSQGSVSEALSTDALLRAELRETVEEIESTEKAQVLEVAPAKTTSDGKLVLKEEMTEGRLSWSAFKLFLSAFGGPPFWLVVGAGFIFVQLASVSGTWWLGVWATAYEAANGGSVNVVFYLTVYSMIVASYAVVYAINLTVYTFAGIRASRTIHDQLCDKVMGSTLRWLDSTPVGRIISRFTQDVRQVDYGLPAMLQQLIGMSMSMLMQFSAVVFMSPIFVVPGAAVALIGGSLGQVYMAAQLSIKREMSNCRSPLYNHFGGAISGLISIRAYGAESSFERELLQRLDTYSRPARAFSMVNRWIAVRADLLGALFAASVASYLVYFRGEVGASNTGFSLVMAVGFSNSILYWVRVANQVEVAGNSLERISDYLVIEQEAPATEQGKPPAYWPASGSLRAENLCARYSKDGPLVLDNLNFEIKSGERVGIVGRTGSGKSSLTLSLLRMIPTTGVVYFDSRPTHEINLDALRANLTIIPQDPMLVSGTIRSNLDPFSQHDDATLNEALRAGGLFNLHTGEGENELGLDTAIAAGGGNFSVGQRQIIALARAIVRRAKVLILDEATASVDAETDAVIQTSIRTELEHATLITIAHRLQTIADYDKIMVLDAGKLVEFDTPIALLEKEESFFRSLVEESGDRERLWKLARHGRQKSSD